MILLDKRMAKGRGGRPRKEEGERGTRQIRAFEDIADMLGWICHFEGGSVAQILDPMLRAQVAARYAPYAGAVEAIKAAENGARTAASAKTPKPSPRKKG